MVGLPAEGERVEGELRAHVAVPAQRRLAREVERRSPEGLLAQRLVRTRQAWPR